MTNEIKEILDIFKQVDLETDVGGCSNCPRRKDKNRTCVGCLNNAKDKLLDYITNLQEEDERLKLNQTKKVFDTIGGLIKNSETCSYRYLIYDLLGFQEKDYVDLMSGLSITNMLVAYEDYKQRIDKAIEYINRFESIKAYYEYEECGYTEYNYDEDFKQDLLDILRGDE